MCKNRSRSFVCIVLLGSLWGCGTVSQSSPLSSAPSLIAPSAHQNQTQSDLLEVLHKQVRERDRRIAHLQAQLAALKVIAHEQAERQGKLKAPASLRPVVEPSR